MHSNSISRNIKTQLNPIPVTLQHLHQTEDMPKTVEDNKRSMCSVEAATRWLNLNSEDTSCRWLCSSGSPASDFNNYLAEVEVL